MIGCREKLSRHLAQNSPVSTLLFCACRSLGVAVFCACRKQVISVDGAWRKLYLWLLLEQDRLFEDCICRWLGVFEVCACRRYCKVFNGFRLWMPVISVAGACGWLDVPMDCASGWLAVHEACACRRLGVFVAWDCGWLVFLCLVLVDDWMCLWLVLVDDWMCL